MGLKMGSLFDGAGGFPYAATMAGFSPIWASEVEPFPILVTSRRFPHMRHLGDICGLDGGKIEPADVVTFGSPCQDLSVAGLRKGLAGERSGLFREAIRIIKEMREATNGEYPKFIVWENVPGAFSSNGGEDFRSVLEETARIKDGGASIPRPDKGRWRPAGEIVGDNYSVAWRVLDAQYWGVPQRRKRIYLVADFAGRRAGKILFERESLLRNPETGGGERQGAAGGAAHGLGATGIPCVNPQGGSGIQLSEDKTLTLVAQDHGKHPCILDAAGFCTEHSAKARSIGYEEGKSPTLRAGVVPAAVYENHSQDTRYTGPLETAPTVSATYGTGGNNQPFVVKGTETYDVRFTSDGTKNARANVYETDTARTIDTGIPSPDRNQGGLAIVGGAHDPYREETVAPTVDTNGARPTCNQVGVSVVEAYSTSKTSYHTRAEKELASTLIATDYKDPPTVSYGIGRAAIVECIQGSAIGRQDKNGPQGNGVNEDVSFTLNTIDRHAVAYHAVSGTEAPHPTRAVQDGYTVRRLTPTECARLQGFPDWWCDGLAIENPADEDIAFWRDVFETHRKATGASSKPKTDNQIAKWLKDPRSDSAEYKMWGNSLAIPCAYDVLAGIAEELRQKR